MTSAASTTTPSPPDRATLQALTGQRLGPYNSFNPVSRVQIWQWCSAMGDRNPLYLDEHYHAAHGIAHAIAPPAMMQMWTMRDVNMQFAPDSTLAAPYKVFDQLSALGYAGNVAVSYALHFHRYLQEGDRVHHYSTVEAISDCKQTALGMGFFVTEHVEYFDQNSQCFAEARITYLQYAPWPQTVQQAESKDSTDRDTATVAQQAISTQADFLPVDITSVTVGQRLPELVIPITHKLIVAGAIATQDFIDVHHNAPAARAAAMPDIFMNILTSCGLSTRYLSDWAGPASRVRQMTFRLQAPNTPGDIMRLNGTVKAIEKQADTHLVSIDFIGSNHRGTHISGSAQLGVCRT